MLKHWFGMALALSVASMPAWAGDTTSSNFRPLLGIGYTFGGDTLVNVGLTPSSGSGPTYEENLSGGAGLDLRAGLSWHLTERVRLQGMVAYHNDSANGKTAQVSYRRIPVELLAHWAASDNWWIGGGVRKALQGRFDRQAGFTVGDTTLDAYKESIKFSTGLVLEAEYMMSKNWGAKFRVVKESGRFETDTEKFNADHIGAIVTYNFD